MHRESLQNSATVTYDQLQASLLSSDSRMLHQMTDMIFDLLSQENNTYFWGAQLFSLCRKATADGFKTCNWILISWVAQLHFDTQIWTTNLKLQKQPRSSNVTWDNVEQWWARCRRHPPLKYFFAFQSWLCFLYKSRALSLKIIIQFIFFKDTFDSNFEF